MRDYPDTAQEYAQELNAGRGKNDFKLIEDPEHWAEIDIRTGEELAHYLAQEAHYTHYANVYGVRPRHIDYDSMSVEEIEAENEELRARENEMDDEDPYFSRGHDPEPWSLDKTDYRWEKQSGDVRQMRTAQRKPDEYDMMPKRSGMGRRAEGTVTRMKKCELQKLVREAMMDRSEAAIDLWGQVDNVLNELQSNERLYDSVQSLGDPKVSEFLSEIEAMIENMLGYLSEEYDI